MDTASSSSPACASEKDEARTFSETKTLKSRGRAQSTSSCRTDGHASCRYSRSVAFHVDITAPTQRSLEQAALRKSRKMLRNRRRSGDEARHNDDTPVDSRGIVSLDTTGNWPCQVCTQRRTFCARGAGNASRAV